MALPVGRRVRVLVLFVAVGLAVLPASAASGTEAAAQEGPSPTTVVLTEGSLLSFDISPDGAWIVFDVAGQIWRMASTGGRAEARTDALRDTADYREPLISPDGRSLLLTADRDDIPGFWLMDLETGDMRRVPGQAVDLRFWNTYPRSWSPDGERYVYSQYLRDPETRRVSGRLHVTRPGSGVVELLDTEVEGMPLMARDPTWSPDGSRIAFVDASSTVFGTIWEIELETGDLSRFAADAPQGVRPAYAPDGRRLAFFVADGEGGLDLAVAERQGSTLRIPLPGTSGSVGDQARDRVAWKDGDELVWSRQGRLWSGSAFGGEVREIPFEATLHLPPPPRGEEPLRIPGAGERVAARGFTGLAVSPSGRRLAMITLGRLYVAEIGAEARVIAELPQGASGLAWSADEQEVAWSAGPVGHEDVYVTSLVSGAARRLTGLAGQEVRPSWSHDGRSVAFIHRGPDGGGPILRVVQASAPEVRDSLAAPSWGPAPGMTGPSLESVPQWSPDGTAMLLHRSGSAVTLLRPGVEARQVEGPAGAAFMRWGQDGRLRFVVGNRLREASLDTMAGAVESVEPATSEAAAYPTLTRDGRVLFVGEDGLILSGGSGAARTSVGWPVTFETPVPEPLLVRNVRILDPRAGSLRAADVLLEEGRIRRIEDPGQIIATGIVQVLDGGGRVMMPGLMDLHAHLRNLSPAGLLYHGVTTVREMGGDPIAVTAALRDGALAGVVDAPRVILAGLQLAPGCIHACGGDDASQQLRREAAAPALSIVAAFGADWLKMYMPHTTRGGAHFLDLAREQGFRVSGHVAHRLPFLVRGMDTKEHMGQPLDGSWNPVHPDLASLSRYGGVAVVPTFTVWDMFRRLAAGDSTAGGDEGIAFLDPAARAGLKRATPSAALAPVYEGAFQGLRTSVETLAEAGVILGAGTDVDLPWGVHMELEAMVLAGLSPAEAIATATVVAAEILGAGGELGLIEVGRRADLVLLDANPLDHIGNTRSIAYVIKDGAVVDRERLMRDAMAAGGG